MSDEQGPDIQNHIMVLPAFGKVPILKLDMKNVRLAESRLIEAKSVSPFTYPELEHTFNESYRDLRKHIASIGYALVMAKKSVEDAKADVILGDAYAEFLAGKPKSKDNSDTRNAFLARDPAYSAALEREAQLNALSSNLDGKIKVMENVCRFMKLQMNLLLRSGVSNSNYYVTSGKK
jgi:hypothetical protein